MGTRRATVRLDRALLRRLLVVVGLVAFVVGVYVLVVLGGGLSIGRTAAPSVPLSVLATLIVALLFAPVQAALEGFADRVGAPAEATPYEVLSRFTDALTGGDATAELPRRISMMLAQGTGAQWAQVWLDISGRLTLAAAWPSDADADTDTDTSPPSLSPADVGQTDSLGRRSLSVRHGDRLLGVLRLQERPGSPLTAVEEGLFAGLAAQAGLMLRLVALRAELEERREELAARADDLNASRERLIMTQDAERRHLERDIHDGAQQHLVALTVNLRLAQTIAGRSSQRAALILAEQAGAAEVAIETLSSLSRGIYPRVLADEGLLPALQMAAGTSSIPVTVHGTTVERLPSHVEAALYFSCMEAVQNAAKHSGAQGVSVRLDQALDRSRLTVADNGTGFDALSETSSGAGAGLANMRDRLDAVGGTLTVESVSGRGTTITAEVPRKQQEESSLTARPSVARQG